VGSYVPECEGIARSRSASEWRLVLERPSLRMQRAEVSRHVPAVHLLVSVVNPEEKEEKP